MLISVSDGKMFCLFCHVLAHFVLVLQVGVKNITNHNNHVPLGQLSLVVRKPVFGVSDLVRHKPGCAATEDDWRLEILY